MNWAPFSYLLLSVALSSCAISTDSIDHGRSYIGRTTGSIVSEFGIPSEVSLISPIAPLGKEYTQKLTYYFKSDERVIRPFTFWVQNGHVTTHEEIGRFLRMQIVSADSSENIEAIIESQNKPLRPSGK